MEDVRLIDAGPRRYPEEPAAAQWMHKLDAILATFDEEKPNALVWLDWDVYLAAPLPRNFWRRLAQGQPLQSPLRRFVRSQCSWRSRDCGVLSHGSWMYFRGRELVVHVADLMRSRPDWRDEHAVSWLVDQRLGGWPNDGGERYRAAGYEPYCYRQRACVHQPEVIIFEGGPRAKYRPLARG